MIRGLAFSADGKRLASGDGSPGVQQVPGIVKLWDVQTGQELSTLKGNKTYVPALAFSPDGKRLATRSARLVHELKMWDTLSGQELFSREVDFAPLVGNVVFSPDGKRVVTGSSSRASSAAKVFDAEAGKELLSVSNVGRAFAFSADGKRLAGASRNSSVMIWDAETGEELLSFGTEQSRGVAGVVGLAFTPDGKRLASATGDGTVQIWDTQSGQMTITFEHSGDRGYSPGNGEQQSHNIAFSADGHRLASVLWDGTVRIWDATPLPEKP